MPAFPLPEGRPAIMGVLNVTPDSFSDGGQFLDEDAAVQRGEEMLAEGADLIDVGGESTRPGAEAVEAEEELRRVLPVVKRLVAAGAKVSIDTSKHEVAAKCLEAGATVLNDVTALRDPAMAKLCVGSSCTVCLMHMQGDPRTMQESPHYEDVVADVRTALLKAAQDAEQAGIGRECIWLDPGIGFGKTLGHNLQLLSNLETLVATGYPILVGVSRKSFIGKLLGPEGEPAPADERLEGALSAQVLAQAKGARIIRTHDVKAAVRASLVACALLSQRQTPSKSDPP